MQEAHQSAVFPSTHSAFVRPQVRTRPDIAANPNLCISLPFGDRRHQETDVATEIQETIESKKKAFVAKWCNSEENPENGIPSTGWVPISPATDPPPSILASFETVELKLRRRPDSPIPFSKENPLFDKPNAEERSDADPNTDGTGTPPTPPSSPQNRSVPETTTASNKRLQLKITDVFPLKKSRSLTKTSGHLISADVKTDETNTFRRKRRKTWSN